MKVLVIDGVNLNLTGVREKEIYGTKTLEEIHEKLKKSLAAEDEIAFVQSNYEGAICEFLQEAATKGYDGILLNAGAYSHYSYAIRDAVAASTLPVIEVHMSNISAREEFRQKSVLSAVCRGTVFGLGAGSYLAALTGLKEILSEEKI